MDIVVEMSWKHPHLSAFFLHNQNKTEMYITSFCTKTQAKLYSFITNSPTIDLSLDSRLKFQPVTTDTNKMVKVSTIWLRRRSATHSNLGPLTFSSFRRTLYWSCSSYSWDFGPSWPRQLLSVISPWSSRSYSFPHKLLEVLDQLDLASRLQQWRTQK